MNSAQSYLIFHIFFLRGDEKLSLYGKHLYRHKRGPNLLVDISFEACHIWVFHLSSRRTWHTQIWASPQFAQIWLFINCLIPIKTMEKSVVSMTFMKQFLWHILFQKLCAAHHAVVSEAVA